MFYFKYIMDALKINKQLGICLYVLSNSQGTLNIAYTTKYITYIVIQNEILV